MMLLYQLTILKNLKIVFCSRLSVTKKPCWISLFFLQWDSAGIHVWNTLCDKCWCNLHKEKREWLIFLDKGSFYIDIKTLTWRWYNHYKTTHRSQPLHLITKVLRWTQREKLIQSACRFLLSPELSNTHSNILLSSPVRRHYENIMACFICFCLVFNCRVACSSKHIRTTRWQPTSKKMRWPQQMAKKDLQ